MRNHVLSILFILLWINLYAQEEGNYKISEAFPEVEGWSFMVKGDEVLFTNGKIIRKYNSQSLQKISESTIKNMPPEDTWGLLHRGQPDRDNMFYIFQGNAYFFYYNWDDKSDRAKLFFRKVDFKTGTASPSSVLVTTIKKHARIDRMIRGGRFNIIEISPDGTKLSICINSNIFVYDKEMELLWHKKNANSHYEPTEVFFFFNYVANDGSFYSLVKKRHGVENRGKVKKSNYTLDVVKINKDEFTISEVKNYTEETFINNFNFYETSKGEIKGIGLFNNEGYYADGIVSLNLEDLQLKYTSFSPEIVYYYSSKIPKKVQTRLNLTEIQIYPNSNGDILFTGETHSSHDGNIYYRDFIIANLNEDQKIEWIKILPHRTTVCSQMSMYRCHSYQYVYLNDKHYMIYLDHPKNETFLPKRTPRDCANCKRGFLRAYAIDNKGEITKESFIDLSDKIDGNPLWYFQIPSITPVSDSEFILKLRKVKKKEEFLVKIKTKG